MDEKEHCPDCDGSLEARLREQAATLAAQDDSSTEYVRELLEEAAQAVQKKTPDRVVIETHGTRMVFGMETVVVTVRAYRGDVCVSHHPDALQSIGVNNSRLTLVL